MSVEPHLIIKLLSEGTDWASLLINFVSTLLAVIVGACGTFYLYNKEQKDKNLLRRTELEVEQVKAVNFLIVHLWTALSDAITNNKVTKEQEDYFSPTYPVDADRNSYVIENNSNLNIIEEKSQYFIEKLPCLSLYSSTLKTSFKWSKIYRDRRNSYMKTNNIIGYKKTCISEYKNNKSLIIDLCQMLLVIYDYAITNWDKKYAILKISKREYISNVWLYLDEDFTRVKVETAMQYKFKNKALVKWFFVILKERCERQKGNKK